jgi:hypothetical protein
MLLDNPPFPKSSADTGWPLCVETGRPSLLFDGSFVLGGILDPLIECLAANPQLGRYLLCCSGGSIDRELISN